MTEATESRPEFKADASAQRIARVYAEALLDEAQRQNAAEATLEDLEALLRDVSASDPLIAAFFLGGVIGRETRAKVLRDAFGGRSSDILLNFLLVLNEHDRLELLRPILSSYRDLLEVRTGKVRVLVRSAEPLPDDQKDRLVGELRDMLHREPVLEMSVDPDLVGGLVVQVGDWLYDASVKNRLESLRDELVERSSHAIQVGRDRFSSP
jgi:F-type H+-transporting ATPase subunit delta